LDDDELAGTEMPEQAARKRREDTKVTRIVHWDKLARCERRRLSGRKNPFPSRGSHRSLFAAGNILDFGIAAVWFDLRGWR
jgi:hypothetical protein